MLQGSRQWVGGKQKYSHSLEQLGIGRERNVNVRADGVGVNVTEVDGVLAPGKTLKLHNRIPIRGFQALRKLLMKKLCLLLIRQCDRSMTHTIIWKLAIYHPKLDADYRKQKKSGHGSLRKKRNKKKNYKKTSR